METIHIRDYCWNLLFILFSGLAIRSPRYPAKSVGAILIFLFSFEYCLTDSAGSNRKEKQGANSHCSKSPILNSCKPCK